MKKIEYYATELNVLVEQGYEYDYIDECIHTTAEEEGWHIIENSQKGRPSFYSYNRNDILTDGKTKLYICENGTYSVTEDIAFQRFSKIDWSEISSLNELADYLNDYMAMHGSDMGAETIGIISSLCEANDWLYTEDGEGYSEYDYASDGSTLLTTNDEGEFYAQEDDRNE